VWRQVSLAPAGRSVVRLVHSKSEGSLTDSILLLDALPRIRQVLLLELLVRLQHL
jgi:hypothetical protein